VIHSVLSDTDDVPPATRGTYPRISTDQPFYIMGTPREYGFVADLNPTI